LVAFGCVGHESFGCIGHQSFGCGRGYYMSACILILEGAHSDWSV